MATNTDYPTLRQNLGQQYAAIPDARLAAMLSGRGIEAEAMEGFLSDMGGFLAKAAPTVLPIAGKVVGSIYGGPAGAAIGRAGCRKEQTPRGLSRHHRVERDVGQRRPWHLVVRVEIAG